MIIIKNILNERTARSAFVFPKSSNGVALTCTDNLPEKLRPGFEKVIKTAFASIISIFPFLLITIILHFPVHRYLSS
jgi:sorbitol-specific phosphotransferase system component IIC